ncbi:MAG: hypothetical protein ABIH45_04120 [Candidatus Omnitrophota bacterium]
MEFNFSNQNLSRPQATLQRFFEILPGILSWGIILGVIVLGLTRPLAVAGLILAFDLYLVLRFTYMIIFLLFLRSRLELEAKTDWLARARGINRLYDYWRELNELEVGPKGKQDLSRTIHKNELRILEKSRSRAPLLEDIHHLIIIPGKAADIANFSSTVDSLLRSDFPSIKISVIFAFEYGVSQPLRLTVSRLIERYRDKLFEVQAVYCPDKPSSKYPNRSAVINFAARESVKYFNQKRIPLEKVITSYFQAGVLVSPDYLSCLTYRFMVSPYRQAACFQSIPVYNYSIWSDPVSRITLNASASFFQLIEAANPDNLVSFSSYSLSLAALAEFDYWPQDSASIDTAMFWKAFIYFNGNFKVIPLYIGYPVKTVVEAQASWFKELYRQKQEQAMAVQDFPIAMRAFLKAGRMPLAKRILQAFKLLEAQLSVSLWPFLLLVAGWFPALLCGREFSDSGTYYSTPRITFLIFSLMVIGLIMSLVLTKRVLPERKSERKILVKIVDWLTLVPLALIGIFLQSLAVLSVQTGLIFGRRHSHDG